MAIPAESVPDCPGGDRGSVTSDVTWLMHRAAQLFRQDLDDIARTHGLNDQRDWVVMRLMTDGTKRTQLAIGQELGLDKTTLTAILDRLEGQGFVIRVVNPHDRRARLPELTDAGRTVVAAFAACRGAFEERKLNEFDEATREAFYRVLHSLASVDCNKLPANGSCM